MYSYDALLLQRQVQILLKEEEERNKALLRRNRGKMLEETRCLITASIEKLLELTEGAEATQSLMKSIRFLEEKKLEPSELLDKILHTLGERGIDWKSGYWAGTLMYIRNKVKEVEEQD